jgi:hypothetical protein
VTEPTRIVVSVRELESVKLMVYQLQALHRQLAERRQPEAEDLMRILRRFTDTHIEDDRV